MNRLYAYQETLDGDDYPDDPSADNLKVGVKKKEANLISSSTGVKDLHMPAIDIDGITVTVKESSTEGNYHLFIDKAVPWAKYQRLLECLADCGIVEKRYVQHSVRRGMTTLRTGKRKHPRKTDGWS